VEPNTPPVIERESQCQHGPYRAHSYLRGVLSSVQCVACGNVTDQGVTYGGKTARELADVDAGEHVHDLVYETTINGSAVCRTCGEKVAAVQSGNGHVLELARHPDADAQERARALLRDHRARG
jgi:hypothetical protein